MRAWTSPVGLRKWHNYGSRTVTGRKLVSTVIVQMWVTSLTDSLLILQPHLKKKTVWIYNVTNHAQQFISGVCVLMTWVTKECITRWNNLKFSSKTLVTFVIYYIQTFNSQGLRWEGNDKLYLLPLCLHLSLYLANTCFVSSCYKHPAGQYQVLALSIWQYAVHKSWTSCNSGKVLKLPCSHLEFLQSINHGTRVFFHTHDSLQCRQGDNWHTYGEKGNEILKFFSNLSYGHFIVKLATSILKFLFSE